MFSKFFLESFEVNVMKNKRTASVLFAVSTIYGTSVAASPGDLDSGFGMAGVVATSVAGNNAWANAVATDAKGRLVVVGGSVDLLLNKSVPIVARYLNDGSPDSTFGDAGSGLVSVTPPEGPGSQASFNTVAIDSKGRIIVGGYYESDNLVSLANIFTIARLLPDGALDASFGSHGIVSAVVVPGETFSDVTSLAIDSDDRVVAVGFSISDPFSSAGSAIVARYNENGGLDHGFASDGVLKLFEGDVAFLNAVSIDGAGRIVIAGTDIDITDYDSSPFVGRILANGDVDTTFGDGSGFSALTDMIPQAIAIDDAGRIVAGGTSASSSCFELARLDASGALDASFGDDGSGIVTTPFGDDGDTSVLTSVAIDPSHNILAGGYLQSATSRISLLRYTDGGSLDSGFGTKGVAFAPMNSSNPYSSWGITIDATNRATLVGAGGEDPTEDLVLARFEN